MNRVILLTSTVRPSVVGKFTGTSSERKKEYLDAIFFYLKSTDLPVVIIDNSGFDFSKEELIPNRFESLSFQGEDIGRGKGWGECQILEYALQNSILLKNADQIVKITGRLIIKNINQLLRDCKDTDSIYADSDLHISYPHSYFFCCSPHFFEKALFPLHYLMNDNEGVHFEHVLGKAIRNFQSSYSFHEFKYPICIEGHPGDSKRYYKKPSFSRYIVIRIKFWINEARNFLYKLKYNSINNQK